MKIKVFLLAILIASAAALGSAPARADGISFKFGYHGGHYGHKHGYRGHGYRKHGYYKKRRYRRRYRHGHHHRHWRPYYPKRQVYIYDNYYDRPSYHDPAYTKVAPAPAPAPVATPAPKEEYCREYTREVIVDGQPAQAYGQACRQPDGSWRIVSEQ